MINPTHFDLQSLRIFLMVAQAGSLTKATDKSNMTLSALSKRIADLERTVDTALFVRLPRGLELTSAGEQLIQHARSVLDTVNRMAGDMGDFAIGVRGHVRIWANTSAIIQFLPADLASFVEVHPLIRISLEEMLSDQIVAATLSGEADLGIFADNVSSHGLEKYLYRRDKLMVVVRTDHALATLPEVSFSDTLDYDFVGLNYGSSLLKRLTDASLAHDKPLRLRIQVSSFDGMCGMIAAGLGIGVLPDGAIPLTFPANGLRSIPLTDLWAQRTLWLGVKSESALVPEAFKLLTHLRAVEPN
ncbi:LysR family transcriptional regulator [Undibacterium crateris]|uniref:LysR family transcriptional regulator n=1 Tax=Undibacterium crateris TaxID=2528175 RepID=UPI0013899F97|nr:LysR family transcriptional regulator [Undibacterium crateris]NDI87623.1 LysR family transcriptional regulator [Undibacterium crateris]